MARKHLHSIIAIASCIAVVPTILGVGYSLWDFSTGNNTTIKVDVMITAANNCGNFEFILPNVAVLDEGNDIFASTLTGISFYKEAFNTQTNKSEVTVDTDLSIKFKQVSNLSPSILPEDLFFGFRISVTGLLNEYIVPSQTYYSLDKLNIANNDDLATQYKDLGAIARQANYDGSTNYEYSDGVHTFKLSTVILNSFFTYREGLRPTTDEKYQALRKRLDEAQKNNEPSYFQIDLLQGV